MQVESDSTAESTTTTTLKDETPTENFAVEKQVINGKPVVTAQILVEDNEEEIHKSRLV